MSDKTGPAGGVASPGARVLEDLDKTETPTDSLTQKAYRLLEEQIVTLQLLPGAVLSESALSKQFAIGRTPVREALQQLAREGLVLILPRRGILVSELNVRRQLRLLELRREVERLMARKAARRSTPAEKEAFALIAEGMHEAARINDGILFMRFDRQLNLLLCQAARNEFINSAMALTHGMSRRFWYSHYQEVADLPLCARLHAAVASAVAKGDGEAAAATTDALIDYVEQFTRDTLDFDDRG